MKPSFYTSVFFIIFLLSACSLLSPEKSPGSSILAEFTESFVKVSIVLERGEDGSAVLAATFTPTEADAHLYSMELPKDGIEGLGRPTLIELPTDARMHAKGELEESVPSIEDTVASDLPALPVYPAGAVTLRLPISLPDGDGKLVDDQVLITYMACTPRGCHKPVLDKLVDLRVPTE